MAFEQQAQREKQVSTPRKRRNKKRKEQTTNEENEKLNSGLKQKFIYKQTNEPQLNCMQSPWCKAEANTRNTNTKATSAACEQMRHFYALMS